jgi:hypothetical protein
MKAELITVHAFAPLTLIPSPTRGEGDEPRRTRRAFPHPHSLSRYGGRGRRAVARLRARCVRLAPRAISFTREAAYA